VPAVPCYLFAHSMGTLIATLALRQLQPTIKAAVFSGCPIFPGYASSSPFGVRALYPLTQTGVAIYLAQLLASMDPKGPAAPILFDGLFSDEESKQRLLKDRRRVEGEVMNKTVRSLCC
jgi:alpha-beta hydrolase superfamily lysophospholipase